MESDSSRRLRQVAGDHLVDRGKVVLLSGALDLELPVFVFPGPARLEPDEGPHRVPTLVVGDVHADEAARHHVESQVAAEGVDRVFRPLLRFERFDAETLEEVPRVLVGQLEPARGGSPLGNRPVGPGQQLSQRVPLGRRERYDQSFYPRVGRHVVPDQERLEDRGILLLLDSFEETVLATDHSAFPDADQHAHCVVAVARVPDDIGVPRPDYLDARRLVEAVEPAQGIAQLTRPLEIVALAGLEHRLAHFHPHVLGSSLEEVEHILHHAPVVALGLPSDAGCKAPADVVVETGPLAGFPRDVVGAAPHGVEPADDRQGSTELRHVGIGPEIPGPRNVAATRDDDPGKGSASVTAIEG